MNVLRLSGVVKAALIEGFKSRSFPQEIEGEGAVTISPGEPREVV